MPRRPLDEALSDPGFTPGARDVAPLVARLVATDDDDDAARTAKALARVGLAAVAELRARGLEAHERGGARAARLLGRLAPAPEAEAALVALLEGGAPKTARAAARALGAFPAAEARLVAAWDAAEAPELRRALAHALRHGTTEAARERLAGAGTSDDALLGTLARRGALAVERTRARAGTDGAAPPAPDPGATVPAGLRVRLRTKPGFAPVAADEASALGATHVVRSDTVELDGPLPLGALLALRTVVDVGVVLPGRAAARPADAVVDALAAAAPTLRALTRGTPTVRVAFARGGHRRSELWAVAEGLAARAAGVRSDPSGAPWEARVFERRAGDEVEVELVARRVEDARFSWRAADVPAASHPSVAAALARTAGVREDDVVWDPFCGSGAELLERAALGPAARLVGTDVDGRALEAARANAARVGVSVELVRADACTFDVRPTLVLTNPPLGRRVARGSHRDLLERFLRHAAAVLAPDGRLVWISPSAAELGAVAEEAGLVVGLRQAVDLGGVAGHLEVWAPRPARTSFGRRRPVPRSGRP